MPDKSVYYKSITLAVLVLFACGAYYSIMNTITPISMNILAKKLNHIESITPSNIGDKNISQKKQVKNILHKIEGNEDSNSGNCTVRWNNPKVNVKYYEYPVHNQEAAKREHFEVPIQPIYKDPIIRLDSEKFMLPFLINGPNNQLTGFREAAFVAIRLNRTIVLPRFFKHFTDSSVDGYQKKAIYPGHRLNIETFCKFVSCVTIEQFRVACGYQLDTFFHLREFQLSTLKFWMKSMGMKITGKVGKTVKLDDLNMIPPNPPKPEMRLLKFGSDEIKTIFSTEAKCTVYPYALYNLHIRGNGTMTDSYNVNMVRSAKGMSVLPNPKNFRQNSEITDVGMISDHELFVSLVKASGSPEYMRAIAKMFVEKTIKNKPFVCVHWRYNRNDFMNRCKSKVVDVVKTQLCASAMQIKPEDIARSIETKITSLKNSSNVEVGNVYIASPLSERGVVARVAKILYDDNGFLTQCSLDLEEYLQEYNKSCKALREHFEDIISTIEMEICLLGTTFLGSAGSSWSGNVHLARRMSQENTIIPESDGDIFKIATAIMKERKSKKRTKT